MPWQRLLNYFLRLLLSQETHFRILVDFGISGFWVLVPKAGPAGLSPGVRAFRLLGLGLGSPKAGTSGFSPARSGFWDLIPKAQKPEIPKSADFRLSGSGQWLLGLRVFWLFRGRISGFRAENDTKGSG